MGHSRVAITGATGLLGSHLANSLLENNFEVFGLIKDENHQSLLSHNVRRFYGDMNVSKDLSEFIDYSKPDYFFHLAALTQAYDSIKNPYQTFYSNCLGTINVLENLRIFAKCKAIVVASSDKAYGELLNDSYTELHPLNGTYPYDASKSITDVIAKSYRNTYAMPITITRACNIYGKGDFNFQRLIPGLILSYIEQSTFTVRNEGSDLREYIHVDDVVNAYEKIMVYTEEVGLESAFNISSGWVLTTNQVIDIVQSIIKDKVKLNYAQVESLEIKKQALNSSLLRDNTGWQVRKDLKISLEETINWYINNCVS